MKQAIYVPFSRRPQEVYVLRSTEKCHFVIDKGAWARREYLYGNAISSCYRALENEAYSTTYKIHAAKRLAVLLEAGNAETWLRTTGYKGGNYSVKRATHRRVFNIENV